MSAGSSGDITPPPTGDVKTFRHTGTAVTAVGETFYFTQSTGKQGTPSSVSLTLSEILAMPGAGQPELDDQADFHPNHPIRALMANHKAKKNFDATVCFPSRIKFDDNGKWEAMATRARGHFPMRLSGARTDRQAFVAGNLLQQRAACDNWISDGRVCGLHFNLDEKLRKVVAPYLVVGLLLEDNVTVEWVGIDRYATQDRTFLSNGLNNLTIKAVLVGDENAPRGVEKMFGVSFSAPSKTARDQSMFYGKCWSQAGVAVGFSQPITLANFQLPSPALEGSPPSSHVLDDGKLSSQQVVKMLPRVILSPVSLWAFV